MNFDNDGVSFCAVFSNGYAIRKLADFFKDAYQVGEWIFSAEGIHGYGRSDCMSSYFTINAESIPGYTFTCPPPPAQQYCRFGIDFVTFNNHIKSITKKKKVALIKAANSVNLMLEYDGDKSSTTWISGRNDKKEYIPEPNTLKHIATCSVANREFKEKLVKFSTLKLPNVKIMSYPKTLIVQGVSENETNGYVKQFGLDLESQDYASNPDATFMVLSSVLKKVSKMADITATDGIIKLWGQGITTFTTDSGETIPINPLLRVQCSIGSYGELKTYVFGALVEQ